MPARPASARNVRAGDLVAVDVRNDADLTNAAAKGETAAFEELYRRHADAAWRVAMAVTRNPHDAADAVSDAFARVFQALPQGRLAGGVPFRPYLLTTARNAAVDVLRRAGRLRPVDELEDVGAARAASGPADHTLAGEDAALVAQAFSDLPERWRSVLWLTEVEGIPAREVASRLGLTANGAAQLAVRARAGLRERYLQAHVRAVPAAGACKFTVERLGAYVGGALSARDLAKVDQHLAACETCTARKDELEDVGGTLRRIIVPIPVALAAVALGKWKLAASHGPLAGASSAAGPVGRALARIETSHRALGSAAAGLLLLGLVSLGAKFPGHQGPTGPVRTPVAQATTPAPAQVQGTTLAATPLPVVSFTAIPDLGGAIDTSGDTARGEVGPVADAGPTAPATAPTDASSSAQPAPAPAADAGPQPTAQVAVGASDGTNGVGVSAGAGDGSCTGLNVGGTAGGCDPGAPTQSGVSVSVGGQQIPQQQIHLP